VAGVSQPEDRTPEGVTYLDHTADVGVRVVGRNADEAFARAASALFARMVDLDRVAPSVEHSISVCGTSLDGLLVDSLDGLLVDWLGALLAEKDVSGLVFGRFEVQIAETADGYRLDGVAWGEPIDVSRHRIGVEVKGISYLGLAVRRERSGETCAEFVLDV